MHLLIQCEVKDEFRAKGLNLETCLGQMYSLQRETYSCQKYSLSFIYNKCDCEKQSYGKHACFHESHGHMKTFALVPNSDSKGFSFLEESKRDLKSMLSNTHSFLTKRKKKREKSFTQMSIFCHKQMAM